jgi:sulfide:quinone oxidoreductase
MANVVVIGAGVGGLPAAYDLRRVLDRHHEITLMARRTFPVHASNLWPSAAQTDG